MAQDLLETAHLEYLLGHGEAARALLLRLLAFDPSNGAARRLLSQVEHRQGPANTGQLRIRWWLAVPAAALVLASLVWLGACIYYGLERGFATSIDVRQFVRGMSFEAPIWVFASLALGALCGSLAILTKAASQDED